MRRAAIFPEPWLRTLAVLVLSLGLGFACASEDSSRGGTHGEADAGSDDLGASVGAPRLEIGTGATEFTALADGDLLDIIQGPQAGGSHCEGHHIWMAVRIAGVESRRSTVFA